MCAAKIFHETNGSVLSIKEKLSHIEWFRKRRAEKRKRRVEKRKRRE